MIEEWYCEDCISRIQREEIEAPEQSAQEDEMIAVDIEEEEEKEDGNIIEEQDDGQFDIELPEEEEEGT